MINKLKKVHNQRGFTLVEMLIVLAITGIIIASVSAVILQTVSVSAASSNRMTAIKQLENALHWIDRDAQQSWVQGVDIDPIRLHWIDNVNVSDPKEPEEHNVTYALDSATDTLTRIDVITAHDGTVTTLNTFIAEYVSDINGTYIQTPNGKYLLIVDITANVEGYRSATESRTLYVMPRASREEE